MTATEPTTAAPPGWHQGAAHPGQVSPDPVDERPGRQPGRPASLGGLPGQVEVLVRRLDPGLAGPVYAQPCDAGADLVSASEVTLAPGERAVVGTGTAIALPEGYAAFVHPRSGLAARHGVTVVNAPGTVDAGYRGEIKVVLINTDPSEPVTLRRGDRIAQLVVQKVERALFREVDELPGSVRGVGGFGSTGGFGETGRETAGVRPPA
ncbi:dUTP diphosphatase [Frankia sp. Ag45/Mut15]|uniref:Deoxyuridine 5'-triphosphate nucleotidohydrolase n=1 Tax=Frankia umida TaxID=573489 RepID=A0ABT0K2P2_9ACTN|nr:dUTP diphosphatase [Frankia umida]MCK9878063.1 dUTP diphosphatase [Frankia umida]